MTIADELEPYFRSGNEVPVTQATIPAELGLRIIKELRRFDYVLQNDTCDLFHYGGDPSEIRDGIDLEMKAPTKHENVPLEKVRGVLK